MSLELDTLEEGAGRNWICVQQENCAQVENQYSAWINKALRLMTGAESEVTLLGGERSEDIKGSKVYLKVI